jgi:cytochrome P450
MYDDRMRLPPGPLPRFFGLPLAERMRRDRLGTLERLAKEFGDIVAFRVGRQLYVLLNHPDYVEDVLITRARLFKKGRALERARGLLGDGLLTSEGDFHRRQRRLAQPAFHKQRIAGYADAMISHAQRMADRWRDGETLDVSAEMNRLTLMIVGETLFGTDVEDDAAGVREALTTVFEAFPITMSPLVALLEHLPLPVMRRYERAQGHLDRLIYRMIEDRRRSSSDRGDLLSMLLLASDDEGDGTGMSDRQVRDEAMTIFLAGHETTANALAWTWLLLGRNQGVERRLHDELDSVLDSRPPTADDVARLPYARMVLAEAMRCYPPAWAIGRRALAEFEIGGYTIPQGTVVLVSQYLMHRDVRFFPEPDRFDPDRWLPERVKVRPKYSYFPFGGGTRVCIGESFAWTEGILVLATLAQRWQLESVDRRSVPMQAVITLRPAGGIRMRTVRRPTATSRSVSAAAGASMPRS